MKIRAINNATNLLPSLVGNGEWILVQKYTNDSLSQYSHFYADNMSSNIVNLTGNVTTSSDPSTMGKTISITTNISTGNTTPVFEYSNYTGIEHVMIK
ncbi:MAG: hypothetical protein KGH88_08700 [Thaumarchaeota archaeon]|nr:hypothetical protein [Nitrososphaerota archaeon]